MTYDEVTKLTGEDLLAAYFEVVLKAPHWEPYVWSRKYEHEPCSRPLDQCPYNKVEHTLYFYEEERMVAHNYKKPHELSTYELVYNLQLMRENDANDDLFIEYWGDDEWFVTNKVLLSRDDVDAWNVSGKTWDEALYRASIIYALGLRRPRNRKE